LVGKLIIRKEGEEGQSYSFKKETREVALTTLVFLLNIQFLSNPHKKPSNQPLMKAPHKKPSRRTLKEVAPQKV